MKTCASCKSPTKCKNANGGKGACLAKAKIKGYKSGASLKEPTNAGLKKLPTEVRNNMGFKKYGGTVKKMNKGGRCMVDGIAMQGKTKIKGKSRA